MTWLFVQALGYVAWFMASLACYLPYLCVIPLPRVVYRVASVI